MWVRVWEIVSEIERPRDTISVPLVSRIGNSKTECFFFNFNQVLKKNRSNSIKVGIPLIYIERELGYDAMYSTYYFYVMDWFFVIKV
jgi:hypothetical protein